MTPDQASSLLVWLTDTQTPIPAHIADQLEQIANTEPAEQPVELTDNPEPRTLTHLSQFFDWT